MIAEAVRRSALADYAERFTALYEQSDGAISIRELPFITQFNLRADPTDRAVMGELSRSLGLDVPRSPNTVAGRGDRRILWLGPDEWLVVAPEGEEQTIRKALEAGLHGAFGSVVDVSANRTVVHVGGHGSRDLLAHGISLDLHPSTFVVARCAQTLLAKTQVIIERPDDDITFHLYVRASFATYVADRLLDAAGG
ncbi:MAG TPA: sarcosine oxidase subunit gamma family protein [Candidatus Acidoferrum sp.]|nr:sarcosine oxidase subunit gamma family protein [Candidatus Acidoferrum sp.]